jgi:hypothetical protein
MLRSLLEIYRSAISLRRANACMHEHREHKQSGESRNKQDFKHGINPRKESK